MRLIVGLGNPGEQYQHTRHNAGFDTCDMLADELGANYWKQQGGALVAKTRYKGEELLLAKPQSYMNTSGGPVKQLCALYGLKLQDIIVIHDELDIEPGSIRLKFGGGLAGHNGLKSIADKLGTRDWLRVRVGIGRPLGRMAVTDWVLSVPKAEAREDFDFAVNKAAHACLCLIDEGITSAQQKYHSAHS